MTRIVAAAYVIATSGAPASAAVTPPTVDDAFLPPTGPPAPRTPTRQTGACPAVGRAKEVTATLLSTAELESAWRLTKGAGQTVAVIDTGVARHRRLPHLLPGGDYVATGDGTQDCDGHGTIVAGIVGAAPDGAADDFSGIAPDAAIIAIRQSSNVFRATGLTTAAGVGDVETLAAAVRTAADAGATVVNISTVACVPVDLTLDDRSLGAALAYAVDVKNVVVVTAAGNVGGDGQCPQQNPGTDPARPGQPRWDTVGVVVSPAWYDDYVLTVGSVDRSGKPSAFTMAGPWVDVAAPGEAVVSLSPDGDGLTDSVPGSAAHQSISGTSYAAPVVTGIAALVRAESPELSARQVMRRIEDTARHPAAGWDPLTGHGMVDALAAMTTGGTRQTPPAIPPTARQPTPAVAGTTARRVAWAGGAACVVAVALSSLRLRRRGESVAQN